MSIKTQVEFDNLIESKSTSLFDDFLKIFTSKKDKEYTSNTYLNNLRNQYEVLEADKTFSGVLHAINDIERNLEEGETYFDAVLKFPSNSSQNFESVIEYLVNYWAVVKGQQKISKYLNDRSNKPSESKPGENAKGNLEVTLENILVSPYDLETYLQSLREIENPVIDKDNNFLLSPRNKGSIVAWIEVLRSKGKLKPVKRKVLCKVLNRTFSKLDISERTLSNVTTSSCILYRAKLTKLIN